MATYKVIQDIEAEDKFVGPLTLKQFVFAMFGSLFGWLSFFVVTKGLFLGLTATVPPMLFGFFMAIPWSSEQPTDLWVLAKIRFRLKPKKRIWDQDGIQELVTITAPKKEEKPRTKDLSQTEVESRLKALAETIDSRGWVIKSSPDQDYNSDSQNDDRLVNPELKPLRSADAMLPDMLEEEHNLDNMILEHDQVRKAQVYEKMDQARYGEPIGSAGSQSTPTVLPPEENNYAEKAVSDALKAKRSTRNIATNNMHAIAATPATTPGPLSTSALQSVQQDEDESDLADQQPTQTTEAEKAQAPMTEAVRPDILELAGNNDWNVSTIARHINNQNAGSGSEEVVVSLH